MIAYCFDHELVRMALLPALTIVAFMARFCKLIWSESTIISNQKNTIMKRILYTTTAVVVFAAVMVSCKDNNRIASEYLPVSSTSELAEFREWQAQKLAKENAVNTRSYATTTTARKKTVYKPTVATAPAPTAPAKKKGWSKAAKGAVIGGVAGAGAGALILKKNRALGAVIGGVVGGGVGYGVGRSMDKKDGRVQ